MSSEEVTQTFDPSQLSIARRLELLERLQSQRAAPSAPALAPCDRTQPIPLSFAQQRLWFLAELEEQASAAYHIASGMKLVGTLHRGALQAALDRIVQRHEVLRTRFVQTDGMPVQQVGEPEPCALDIHDLVAHPDPTGELHRLCEQEARAAFDLRAGPLVRGRLIALSEQEHVLLVTMLHIVSDGWSLGRLTHELGVLYEAFSRGQPDPLPPLTIQYADYADWQRRWARGPQIKAQLAYWREHLRDAPSLLELPTDRPRPAVQHYAGARIPVTLGTELTQALKALSARHGATLYMTLLAGWAALLHRLSGQDDVVIGSPVAGRNRIELEPLIGLLVNTVALRIALRGHPTVADLLAQVRNTSVAAQAHQDVPFEQVVEAVKPARSLAHSPLFQAMLAWQNGPEGRLTLSGLDIEPYTPGQVTAQFDLLLSLGESGPVVEGCIDYPTSLFDPDTVTRWIEHWKRLLQAMASNDTQRVDDIELLGDEERHRILHDWNATQTPYPRERCVYELFEAQVQRSPDAVALVYEDERLSYAELNRRANRLAHALIERGVAPDERVAICLPRSPDMVVAVLAVLKAGGAYVPLDPRHPPERLAFMLQDSAPRVLITIGSLWHEPPGLPVIDLHDHKPVHPDTTPHTRGLSPSHLAYVIYTSGSTGRPKGVMVEHGGLVNYLHWAVSAYAPTLGSVVSSSLSFDATVTSLYAPLLCGGCVTLLPEHGEFDALQALLSGPQRVGLVKITPAHLEALGQQLQARGRPCSADVFVIGGEALPASVVRLWCELAPGVRLVNEYGPTETVVGCVVHELAPDAAVPHRVPHRVPIGRPIANTRIYLLDVRGKPVPVGVVGEIHIGGAGVARGYLHRPELTAERFVSDPFAGGPDARMYKTGDLGRWLPDGTIEYLGRNDHQVKVRGFRIEPGEIEARLLEHPGVREAVVLAREDEAGQKRLVAYLTGDAPLQPEALRTHLAERLPEYMVPAAYVRLDALPLTPNGKLDRKTLPAPGTAAHEQVYAEPQGDFESSLARLWAELLGLDRVGRHDHFFALGGHSLLAMQLLSRTRHALGRDVALAELFAHPVLADFARIVAQAKPSALPPIALADRQAPLPLSYAQQRLWFLAQLEDQASAAYHVPGGLRLLGALDRTALQSAMDRVVQRHEVLRTSFVLIDGTPMQHIAEARPFPLVVHDLASHPDARSELQRLSEEEATAPFDLGRGPLVRGCLVALGAQEHVLLVTLHHIVSDGWSLGRLTHELGVLYQAFSQGQPDPLRPLPIQYADYAQWQRQGAHGPQMQAQLTYWREQLKDVPPLLELPTDRPRPALQDYGGARIDFALDAELTRALKTLGARHGATLYMTLLAGWAALLHRLSGQRDLVIGSPVAGRTRSELEPLIGLFINTLPLRIRLDGAAPVSELLSQVRRVALEGQANQDIPFEQIVEAVNPVRSLSYSPLFQHMFAWENLPEGRLSLSGLDIEPLASEQVTARYDLLLSMAESGPLIEGSIEYAGSLFDAATVARYIEHWRVMLTAMASDDAQALGRLPMLTPAQWHQMLLAWNATQADYPRDRCIHQLFEAQVERSPESVAVTQGPTSLTYTELNAQANRLAHHLIAMGVGADERVAIAVPRTPAMLVGLLAILKAGGAYVPIDPVYPQERVAYMLADAAPCVLLTEASLEQDWTVHLPSHRVVCLDSDAWHWSGQPDRNPEARAQPQHLAYVIYTSGSTGQPKGVMVPHRGVVNLLCSMQRSVGIGTNDRVLAITTLSFDIAALELHGPLVCGAQVIVADRDTVLDPVRLARCLEDHRVTMMQATPGVWRMLLDSAWSGRAGLKALCGGERLGGELAQRLQARTEALWNVYGPTETTIWSTAHRVQHEAGEASAPPIGHPVANTRVYVLDAHGMPTPAGVIGEIHIAGDGVACGYLHRPELTVERFLPDPFAPSAPGEPAPRMYRTGDLGRWRADGVIEYHGRNDFEVKIRGVRVHPAEVESALACHPGVREAAVVAREHGAGDQRLVAYVAARDTVPSAEVPADISFSLFYFGADVHDAAEKYDLYLESAQYADRHGFEAVWTPERHFHSVGGLYANPSVLSAALATVTRNVKLRSGSVVLPLHHPLRVAEEWSMVDNLSHGRAGMSIASGWHPRDFVLSPDAYASRKQEMLDGIQVLRALWRGESMTLRNGVGELSDVRIFPQPVQKEVPLWVTAAVNPDTFIQAGRLGANVLTHLLGQSLTDLAEQIARYRQARLQAGHDPETGRVTLMVHTFLGADTRQALQQAKAPFMRYLKEHFGLNALAHSFGNAVPAQAEHDLDALAEVAFEHYSQTAALIGTPQSCLPLVHEARNIGVDELACLIDWMDAPSVMASLEHLNHLRELARHARPSARELRRFLAARLPEHMVPSAVVFVDALPMTANGKLDRKALPAPQAEASAIHGYEAPAGPLETAIATLWSELLGVDRVGRHDNFFELGGNSLMVVSMLERLRQAAMPAEVRTLFANPTPALLAAAMAVAEAADEAPSETIEMTL